MELPRHWGKLTERAHRRPRGEFIGSASRADTDSDAYQNANANSDLNTDANADQGDARTVELRSATGTKLTVHTGDLTITTAGSLIDGLDIRGYVVVKAPNVTIRRSIIRGGPVGTVNRGMLAITQPGAGNFLVEDVTIVPSNPSPYINGINVNQPGIIRRADISGTVDGMMIYGSGVRIEGSYLHDFAHYTKDPNWGGVHRTMTRFKFNRAQGYRSSATRCQERTTQR